MFDLICNILYHQQTNTSFILTLEGIQLCLNNYNNSNNNIDDSNNYYYYYYYIVIGIK